MGSRPVLVIPNISLASFGYAPSVAVAMRFPSLRRDRVPVTGAAHLRVLLPQALGVEPRAVGIDAPGAQRRMAREAVVFHVTPDAGLETLAGGLPVTGAEEAV